jgi:hypothetical protein
MDWSTMGTFFKGIKNNRSLSFGDSDENLLENNCEFSMNVYMMNNNILF